MQCDCMALWPPHGPISEGPQHFDIILHNGPFILCCEEWPVLTELWILKPLTCEFPWSVGMLEPLQCGVSQCLYFQNRKYHDLDFGFLTVNELVSTTRCQRNQYSKHFFVSEGQFQNFQNMVIYVLSQLSFRNLVSWPKPYWFERCPLFEALDSSQCLCFHSLQIADRAHGLPKTWCGRLHWDCSWMHLIPVVWRAPCTLCGSSKLTTQFLWPRVLIAARVTSSNLRRHCQL